MTGGVEKFSKTLRYDRIQFHGEIFLGLQCFFRSRPRLWRGKCRNSRNLTGHRRADDPPSNPLPRSAIGWHCWPLVASQPAIAAMLGCCERTLRYCFKAEFEIGRGVKRAENLERLEAAAKGGSIGAMKTLEAIFGHAETKQLQGKSKPEARPSKRTLAARAAAAAGGAGTPWGSDLIGQPAGGHSRFSVPDALDDEEGEQRAIGFQRRGGVLRCCRVNVGLS